MGYNLSGSIGITGSLNTTGSITSSNEISTLTKFVLGPDPDATGFGKYEVTTGGSIGTGLKFQNVGGLQEEGARYQFSTLYGTSPQSGSLHNLFIKDQKVGINSDLAGRTASLTVVGDIEILDGTSAGHASTAGHGSGSLLVENHITASGNISSSLTGSFAIVGIGTDSPAYDLDLGENSSTIRLVSENNGTAIRIGAGGNSNDVTLIRVDGSDTNHDGESDDSHFGFSLKYMGSRAGNLNSLSIFSDAETGTAVEALTILQDGKIGIGIDAPANELVVKSSTDTSIIQISDDDTDAFLISKDDKFSIGSSNTDTDLFFVDLANDRVGIGPGTPGVRFHIFGASTSNTTLKIEGTNTAARPKIILGTLRPSSVVGTHTIESVDSGGANGGEILRINTDEKFEVQTNSETRLHLNQASNNGRLGINTTSPESTLHLLSSGSDTGLIIEADTADDIPGDDNNPYIRLTQDGGTTNAYIGLTGGNSGTWPDGGDLVGAQINNLVIGFTGSVDDDSTDGSYNPNKNIQLATNNQVRLHISSSGNVGIETTAPDSHLVVGVDRPLRFGIGATPGTVVGGTISSQGSFTGGWANYFKFLGGNLASPSDHGGFYGYGHQDEFYRWGIAPKYDNDLGLHISSSGDGTSDVRVGIGTISPTARLNVHEATGTAAAGNGVGTLVLSHGDNGGESSITFKSAVNAGSDYGFIRYHDHEPLGNHTGTTENALLEMGTQNDAGAVSGDQMAFSTAGVRRLYIQGNGHVGIGTTSPSRSLSVVTTETNIANFDSTFTGQNYITVRRPGESSIHVEAGATSYGGSIRSSHELRLLAGNQTVTGRNALIIKDPDSTNTETVLVGRGSGQSSIKANTDNGGYLLLDSNGNMLGLNFYANHNVLIANGGGKVGIGATGNNSPTEQLQVIGNVSASGNFYGNKLALPAASTRNKISLYGNGSTYTIGMQSGITFGGLDDWGMTFQFNDEADRGFWWGDVGHTTAEGAMALTTEGRLVVATGLRIGFGQGDTSNVSAYDSTLGTNGTGRVIKASGAIDSDSGAGKGAFTMNGRNDMGLFGHSYHCTLQAPGDVAVLIDSNKNGSSQQFAVNCKVSGSDVHVGKMSDKGERLFSVHQNGVTAIRSASLFCNQGNHSITSTFLKADGNGGFPAFVIKSIHEGSDADADTGGGIRLLDNDSDEYWDNAMIDGKLHWSHRSTSEGTAAKQFKADADTSEQTIAFTGQHPCRPTAGKTTDYSNKVGHIVVADGTYNNGFFSTGVNDKSTPSINEALPHVKLSTKEKEKSVFGVISNAEDLNDVNSPVWKNEKSPKPYREWTNGKITSFLRYEEGDERIWINSLGEGAVLVSNINGNLENGDYITTSAIEGIGMKQDDDLLHNYTVAKITQDENFTSETTDITYNNQTYKIKLVGCTYHCG